MKRVCVLLALAACGRSAADESTGRIVVAVTIDWEGYEITPENLAALADVRGALGPVPFTHFVSAAYATKGRDQTAALQHIAEAVHPGDELAVHLHAWRSLVTASGVAVRSSPSFLSGTDELLPFEDGDTGFDLDLDAYSIAELRGMLRTSRQLLEKTQRRVSTSFRAGGYLTTPKVMLAIRSEGFTVDSSAIDARQLDELAGDVLPARLAEVWPQVRTQPYLIGPRGLELAEFPIAAVSDYAPVPEIVAAIDAAHTELQRTNRDVFVVLAFHLETAPEVGNRISEALSIVRSRSGLAGKVVFTTIEAAAERFAMP